MADDPLTTCPSCGHPHHGAACDNPGCAANPNVSADVKARWAKEHAEREAAAQEREKLARIRESAHWFGTPRYRP